LAFCLNLRSRRRWRSLRAPKSVLPPLALLTDTERLADPVPILGRLPTGSLVILRHYDSPERATLGARLARLCREKRLRLLVAGDFALAVTLAAGLHLPEGLVGRAPARIRLWHRRRRGWLTAAAHGRLALAGAARLRADAALLAPVFPTRSHPGRPGLGCPAFRRLVRGAGLPVYAMGGVTVLTVLRLFGSGAIGVATVGELGS
jgi:thiamine-phosphate pyrophosphorylase